MKGPQCLYPFISAMVSPEGTVRLCSSSIDHMGDLKKESLLSIWRNGRVNEVRNSIKKGEWSEACRSCKRAEEQGLPSKRQKFYASQLKNFNQKKLDELMSLKEPKLQHLDLSFSNLCNLSCVTCSSSYSTGWFRPQVQAEAEGLNYQKTMKEFSVRRLPRERIDEIVRDHLPWLRSIVIKGGEPLIDLECGRFLLKVAESKTRRPDLSIFIQTNGTQIKPGMRDLLGRLKASIGFSIDGTDQVFRWIRGADFKSVLENLRWLGESPGIGGIFLDYTVSAYNVFHLATFAKFALSLRVDNPIVQKCTFMGWANQDYLSPRLLPLEQRKVALEALRSVLKTDPGFFEGVPALERVLMGPRLPRESVIKFIKWKDYCNRMRGFQIESLCPELADLM